MSIAIKLSFSVNSTLKLKFLKFVANFPNKLASHKTFLTIKYYDIFGNKKERVKKEREGEWGEGESNTCIVLKLALNGEREREREHHF